MKVSGQGTIVNASGQSITLKMKDGSNITLTIDGSTQIPAGFTLEPDDIVKVTYISENNTLNKIQVVKKAKDTEAS